MFITKHQNDIISWQLFWRGTDQEEFQTLSCGKPVVHSKGIAEEFTKGQVAEVRGPRDGANPGTSSSGRLLGLALRDKGK